MVEHPSPKRRAAGSSPVSPASTVISNQSRTPWPSKRTHRTSLSTSCTSCGVVVAVLCAAVVDRLDLGLLRHAAERVQRSRSVAAVVATDRRRRDVPQRSSIYYLANEVASELKKVTWPTAKEVRTATLVVIVMAIISAIILGLFDFVWSNLTELVYG